MMRNQQKSSDGVRDKSVKFNPETIETSIGGTNSAGQINVTLSSNISTDDSTNNYSRDDDSLTASSSFVSSSDSSTGEVSVIYRPDGTPSVAKAVELFSSEQTKNKLQTNRAAELRLAEARKQKQADANRNKNTPSRQNGTPSSHKRSVTTAEARSASSNRRSVVQPAKVVKISTPTQSVGSTKSVKSSTPQSVHQKRQFGRSRHGYSMDCSTLDSPVTVDRNSVGNTSVIAARRISELGSAKKPRISSIFQYDDSTCVEDATCSGVTVAVRVKPYSQRDLLQEHTHCVVSMVDNETVLTTDNGNVHRFTYDYSFWSYDKAAGNFADQCHVYETLAQPMLSHAFEGYNVCLFAYGQTGSGKSYSIMGHHNEIGIIPRFCEELFGRLDQRQEDEDNICKTNVEISFFEIYNEKIHDLLGPSTKDSTGRRPNLKVREHPRGGPFVEGLSSHPVKSFEDINGWLTVGNKLRATAATGMNDKSSRSHSVFTMIITKTQTDTIEDERHEHSITSKVNLIDLAGSERQSQARTSGERLREGASINKSLMTLGKVISLLSETSQKKKKIFIPYRDSVLTWLLKESIGGNSKTAMLATISPSNHHQDETLSTLRYAKQARSIMNQARVNEDPKARLIRELRSEIEKLKCKSGGGGGGAQLEMMNQSLAEITSLKSKLRSKEQEMAEMAKSWSSRLQQSEERKLEESRLLEKSGVSLNITSIQPSLVNLNEDPQLNEMLLYLIKEGVNRVGLRLEGCTHDIQLSGALIAKDHCTINNVNGVVSISTVKEASTYVNGSLITQPTILHHGDRVIIGGDHYFRFNHAKEVAHKGRSTNNAGQLKDFEFARQELLRVQEERLEAELEAERERHQREMQERLNDERKQADLKLQDTVEKAHQEMDVQKSEYEQRLEELQFKLDTYRSEVQHTEHDRQKSKHLIDKLEREKLSLETEVRSNRKRLEDEVEANAKAISEIPSRPSAIIALVQKEQERISRNLESLKMRRTPRLQTPLSSRATRTPKNDLYKRSLVLREANRISQFLKKNTVFTFEEVSRDNGETQTCVKVTNTTLGVSTYWTLERFNFRLNEMREMYRESDGKDISSPGATCQVFYNHNDQWQKEERLKKSPSAVPQMVNGIEKMSPVTATAKRLSLGGTPTRKLFDTSGLDDSTLDASCLNDTTFDISSVTNTTTSIVGVCKDLMSIALEGYQGSSLEESVADKMLSACHTIKTTIPQLCNCYTHNKDDSMESDSPDSDTIRVSCIQIQMSLTAIMSHSSSWPQNAHQPGTHSHGDSNRSRLINLMQADVHKLASQFVLLLQGLENDIESMIEKCCAQITQDINALCQHIGELSAATEMSVSVMIVNNNNSGETNSNHNNNIDTVELDEQSQNICTEVRESFQDGYSSFLNCAIHEEDSNYFDNSSLSNSTMNNTLTNRSMDTG